MMVGFCLQYCRNLEGNEMHAYTKLVKKFLNGYMAETREQRGMSKEEISAWREKGVI